MKSQRSLPISLSPSGEPPYAPDLWNKGKRGIKETHNCYTYMMNDLFNQPRINGKPQPGFTKYMDERVKQNLISNQRLSCEQVQKGVHLDNSHIKVMSIREGLTKRCPPNHYKGFLMVSPGQDYHFARQDNRLIAIYRRMDADVKAKRIHIPKDGRRLALLFIKYANEVIPTIVLLAHMNFPRAMKSNNPHKQLSAIFKSGYTWSHKPGASEATDRDADGNIIVNPMDANWNYSSVGGINYNHMCCFFSIPSNTIANTYSTGVPSKPTNNTTILKQNNPIHIRTNISREHNIDSKFERLLKYACSSSI